MDSLINDNFILVFILVWIKMILTFLFALSILVQSSESCQQPNEVDVETLSVFLWDEDENPTAARIRITDMQGQYYAPQDHSVDFQITFSKNQEAIEKDVMLADDRRFAYVNGHFKIDLSPQFYRFEVVKGFHYLMIDDTVEIRDNQQKVDFHLKRSSSISDEGWYSGDVHVHHINPESAILEMKAEDLNVCNILISDFTRDHHLYSGEIEPLSDSSHIIFMGQEYREDLLGHVNLLNLRKGLVEPSMEKRAYQYPLNISASEYVRDQGGHISWAHFAAWPGLEGPLGIALKKVDAVELLCTIDPFHPPIFVTDVIPELPMNSGLRLWYRLLNCGFRVPLTAGTDKMGNLVTVGANRVYAKLEGPLNYARWVEALNEGKTFVSNSPFLTLKVDGQSIGSSLSGEVGDSFEIQAGVWSQMPLDRLEVIANGELIKSVKIPEGHNQAEIEINYEPSESTWICARAYRLKNQYLRAGLNPAQRRNLSPVQTDLNMYFGTLRPETPFAHTSPIYLSLSGNPIYKEADAKYFVQYIDNVMKWLDDKGSFPDEKSKQEVLKEFKLGRDAFLTLGN